MSGELPEWMNRDRYTIKQLWKYTYQQFNKNQGIVIGATVAFFGLTWLAAIPIEYAVEWIAYVVEGHSVELSPDPETFELHEPFWYLLHGLLVGAMSSIWTLGAFAIYFEVLHERKPKFSTLFMLIDRLGPCVQLVIILEAITSPFVVMFGPIHAVTIAVDVALMFLVFFGFEEIAYNSDAKLKDALTISWKLLHGNLIRVLCVFALGMVVAVAGVLLLVLGVILTVPLSMLLGAALFVALRNGGNLPPVHYTLQKFSQP